MRTTPPSAAPIQIVSQPSHFSGGRVVVPKSYIKSRKATPDGADLIVMDVDAFRPNFDVVYELTHNRDAYKGDEKLTIYGWPKSYKTAVDLVRSYVGKDRSAGKPGTLLTLACCTAGSMPWWTDYTDPQDLSELQEELNLDRTVDVYYREEATAWFGSFSVSMIDVIGSGTKMEQDVLLPKHLKAQVGEIAEGLGVSSSVVLGLSVAITLSEQPCVPDEYRTQFDRTIDVFMQRVKLRIRVARMLLGKDKVDEVDGDV